MTKGDSGMREWERNREEQYEELHSNTSVYSPNTKVHRGKSERESNKGLCVPFRVENVCAFGI